MNSVTYSLHDGHHYCTIQVYVYAHPPCWHWQFSRAHLRATVTTFTDEAFEPAMERVAEAAVRVGVALRREMLDELLADLEWVDP